MRETIKKLNKSTLARDTGISHDHLRKFASGAIQSLTNEEIQIIHDYLLMLADKFKL